MNRRSLLTALVLTIGCGGMAAAQAQRQESQGSGPALAQPAGQNRNVGTFLGGAASDQEAFQDAISAVPRGGAAVIAVPSIGRPYRLPGIYLGVGDRHITWAVDPSVTINNGAPGEWLRLRGPVTTGRGILAYGYGNKNDNTGFRILVGGGGVYARPEAKISGYDTVQEQAHSHERGRAGLYMSVSDAGQIGVDGAGIASHQEITLPPETVRTNALRVGMFVDAPGITFPTIKGQPVRYTTRIVDWKASGGFATSLQIEGWYRSNPRGNEAVRELPSVDRKAKRGRVLINPLNKIWGSNVNLYLNKRDAPTFEKTSAAFAEWAIFNNTGSEFSPDFQQHTHPLHFYGVDLANNGKNGGGTAFQARGTQKWEYGFRVKSGKVGFHVDGTPLTDGEIGFATTSTKTGAVGDAFAARTYDGTKYDTFAAIKGKVPEIHLGRASRKSNPALVMHSSGAANAYDAKISASGGRKANGTGALTVEAGRIVLDAGQGIVILRNLPTGADGLPEGALYQDAKGFVKIVQ